MKKSQFETAAKWGLGIGAVIAAGTVALFVLQSIVLIALACLRMSSTAARHSVRASAARRKSALVQ